MDFVSHRLHGDCNSYQNLDEIDFTIIPTGIKKLPFFEDDVFLGMQAINIGLVDQLITEYEHELLHEYNTMEITPDSTMTVSALSQMWIYAIYEVLRMWRDRKFEFEKLQKNGGLKLKIESMIDDPWNPTIESRKKQMLKFQNNPEYRECIRSVWEDIEEIYRAIELLRMNLAKHCAPGKDSIVPQSPGYARINDWCGAMDYQLIARNTSFVEIENDRYYTVLNRRDIADAIRCFIVKFRGQQA